MLWQSVFGRLAGYENVNDAERLRHDPAMRWIVGGKAPQGRVNSPSQMGRSKADYDRLTMVGHSNGGDISMYFAKMYPDQIKKLVTLDNLRVPFMTDGTFKILSFRSKDPQFKTDPGVIPPEGVREKSGITVVQTGYQHTDMSDRGPDDVKSTIQGMLDKFLDDESPLRPVVTKSPPLMTDPGPVTPYVPVAPVQN
jgi:hypothetical protein